jgi:hypothetical protein
VAELDQCGGLDAMRCMDGHLLIALDGTEFHCSDKIHCPNCSHRKRGKDKTEYFHTMLAATLVASPSRAPSPGNNRVVPLEPEFVVPQDGYDKQDYESRAARRWLAAHGKRYARFNGKRRRTRHRRPGKEDRERETLNVLKTKGYNLEHNFAHGKQHLATVLAILNLLAFACHTVCELGDRA